MYIAHYDIPFVGQSAL